MLQISEKIKNNKTIFSNFSYLAILEIFVLIAPLITYPYLVRVLGTELYGWVITAQVTASYASIIIDFGFRRVSAKYVASVRDNLTELSKVVSTVVSLRVLLWIGTLILYIGIVLLIPSYRSQWILFLLSYGLTFSSALLPDFYFQGIENMKYITIINVFTRLLFICSTFFIVTQPSQYILVPALWSIGYLTGGIYSLYVVFKKHNLKFIKPDISSYKFHLRETTPIFLSDVMLNVKDKFSYNLMGGILGMSDVVIYDLGTKIVNILAKPTTIFCSVIFPKMSRNPNVATTKRIMLGLFLISILMVCCVYFLLPYIVKFFIDQEIDLFPLRVYLLVPIFTGLSFYIPSAVFVVFGRNRYVLYSTIVSTISYAIMLSIMWIGGWLDSVLNFIILTVSSYIIETMYRLFLSAKIFREFNDNEKQSIAHNTN